MLAATLRSVSASPEPSEIAVDPATVAVDPTPVEVDPAEIAVDPAAVAEWLARDPELQVVDVRQPDERDAGHIAGSLHIELAQLPTRVAAIDRDRPVVFYCRVGVRSDMAAQALRAAGVQAHSMRGGLQRWAQEGRPLAPADGYVAEH
jgi:rhodanese-related sulfurtransferase